MFRRPLEAILLEAAIFLLQPEVVVRALLEVPVVEEDQVVVEEGDN